MPRRAQDRLVTFARDICPLPAASDRNTQLKTGDSHAGFDWHITCSYGLGA